MKTKELIEHWPMPNEVRAAMLQAVAEKGANAGYLYTEARKRKGARGPWHALVSELDNKLLSHITRQNMSADDFRAMSLVTQWLNNTRGTGFISALGACEPTGRWMIQRWFNTPGRREAAVAHAKRFIEVHS